MQSREPGQRRAVRGKPIGQRVPERSARKKPDAPDVVDEPEPENPHARSGGHRVRSARGPDEPRKAAVRRNRKGEAPPPVVAKSKPHLTAEALAARSEKRRLRHRQRKMDALKDLLAELKRFELEGTVS